MKLILKSALIVMAIFLLSCSGSNDNGKDEAGKGGNITYSVEGATTKISDGVSTTVLGGNSIGTIANSDNTTYVGDPSVKSFVIGTPITGAAISIKINGVQWYFKGSSNTMTITSYDGKTIKGTFAGKVGNKDSGAYVYKNISGSFETTDITKI